MIHFPPDETLGRKRDACESGESERRRKSEWGRRKTSTERWGEREKRGKAGKGVALPAWERPRRNRPLSFGSERLRAVRSIRRRPTGGSVLQKAAALRANVAALDNNH